MAKYIEDCPKCSTGKGYISYFAYYQNGVCFKCQGSGRGCLQHLPRGASKGASQGC